MLELGEPIRIFHENLLSFCITMQLDDNGRLIVGGNTKALSPVYRDEITKRAYALVDLLAAMPDKGALVERDITSYVGDTIDGEAWTALQERLPEGWVLYAWAENDRFHIYELRA